MKIAFVVDGFPKLSETFILNQITGLLDLGHDVDIFAKYKPKEQKAHSDVEKYNLMERAHYYLPENKIIRILKAICLFILYFPQYPSRTLKSLNVFKYGTEALCLQLFCAAIYFPREDYDIIHCHYGPNGKVGAYLKEIGFKAKLITMFHGYGIRLGIKKGCGYYRQLFKSADCILANSNYSYKNLLRFGADPEKTIHHPVGIDISRFPNDTEKPTITTLPEPTVIITVATLIKRKGLEYGIQAINKLSQNNPNLNVEYHIIGAGQLENNLKNLICKLNFDKVVYLKGAMKQDDVIKNLQQAHIFLLPSITEELGVVLLEAQAMGLPIVATSVGGIPEAILPGKSGFLAPEKDANALAEKLQYVIEHPEVWSKMGKYGREHVEKNYDIKHLNQRLEKIYQNLVRNSK